MTLDWHLQLPLYPSKQPPVAQCFLLGYVSNEQQLRQQYAIDAVDQMGFLHAALEKWGKQVNQYLHGDYVLVWQHEKQLLLTSSAHASFTLFYQAQDGLTLAADLRWLKQQSAALVNQDQILQRLWCGPLLANQTCFVAIRSLLPGQTLLWQYQDCLALTYQDQLPAAEQVQATIAAEIPVLAMPDEVDLVQLFNELPSVAHLLGEPVMDATLALFSRVVAECPEQTIALDPRWLSARMVLGEQPFYQNGSWCKGILKRHLYQRRRALIPYQHALTQRYRAAQSGLSFSLWLDRHYVIPAWCQLLQRIALAHGKTVTFDLLVQAPEASLDWQSGLATSGYFSFAQPSVHNIFDATQRLFWNGSPVTRQCFHLRPPTTAKMIKQHATNPQRVEQLCIALLTFDYLARFHRWQLAS